MWRPRVSTAMWYRRDHNHPPLMSKRFVTVLLVFSGIFTVFFYRAAQILHFRIELSRVRFLYRACQEKLKTSKNAVSEEIIYHNVSSSKIDISALHPLLKNMTGSKAASGFDDITPLSSSDFILPHLKKDPAALLPSYHLKSDRELVDVVIGVTNVKRDKRSYLFGTLKDLVSGISQEEFNSTLIIILIGETDLEYVLETAWNIEKEFPDEVKNGLIQVVSPPKSYYPDLESLPPSLGDSPKRVKWRSKEVLDVLYLMAYGYRKGSYYLMMEDDVSAAKNYMKDMMSYITFCTAKEPDWVMIEFSHYFGSLGKLFKSSVVRHFLVYLQLFYHNMPLDFLIESYLRDRVCDLTRNSNECYDALVKIHKKYPAPMFLHVGLYSSLPGKFGKVQDPRFEKGRRFFPHMNPPVKHIRSDIKELPFHTARMAYEGTSMFIGHNPKIGDVIEFWFAQPTALKSFKFQSGNFEHKYDIFVNTDVEVYPVSSKNFTKISSFDELGFADGKVWKYGPLEAIRLRVTGLELEVTRTVVLSEIEFQRLESPNEKCL